VKTGVVADIFVVVANMFLESIYIYIDIYMIGIIVDTNILLVSSLIGF